MWRPADEDRILLMAGRTTGYTMEPRGEYVFGIVDGKPMRSRRGREHRVVLPGQLVAWDPSSAHTGAAINDQPWTSRLVVVEVAHLDTLATDAETDPLIDVAFPEPVLSDPQLATDFLRVHTALETHATRLERDERLAEWLHTLIERSSAVRALPIAHRIRKARRLLEAGQTIAETATATGFADQSHLHRHFQRSLGPTPREYQKRFNA
jgi:Helix-turn-helix domain/AraC-like ligand binding domain